MLAAFAIISQMLREVYKIFGHGKEPHWEFMMEAVWYWNPLKVYVGVSKNRGFLPPNHPF